MKYKLKIFKHGYLVGAKCFGTCLPWRYMLRALATINMKHIFTILILILPFSILAQVRTKIETDSSVIEIIYYYDDNSIRVFNNLKSKIITYYEEYYLDTKQLEEEGIYDHGYPIGRWREYAPGGKLAKETNYNDSIWCFENRKDYRFYDLQKRMKDIGDSIIIFAYGKEFFVKNVEWNSMGSNMYTEKENEFKRWNEKMKNRPTTFHLNYDFRLDANHIYEDMIEISLDSNGNFVPDATNYRPQGFEKLPRRLKKKFKLNYYKAFQISKDNGLIETDSTKAITLLKWTSSKKTQFYNLNYQFYIIQKYTENIDRDKPNYVKKNDFYYVWIFNPWTGKFLGKKEMCITLDWKGRAGALSELHEFEK